MSRNYLSKWTWALEQLSQGKHKVISCNDVASIAGPSALDTLDCPTQHEKNHKHPL